MVEIFNLLRPEYESERNYKNAGEKYLRQDYGVAIEYYYRVIGDKESNRDTVRLSVGNIAVCLIKIKNYAQALKVYDEYELFGDLEMTYNMLFNKGYCLGISNEGDIEAYKYYKLAYFKFKKEFKDEEYDRDLIKALELLKRRIKIDVLCSEEWEKYNTWNIE